MAFRKTHTEMAGARSTVFCAVWSGDPNRHDLLRGHMESLRRQTVPIAAIDVFDDGDAPPEWAQGTIITAANPLTPYQAWNVAVQHASTEFVMNLNLDDRLAPDAVETMQDSAAAIGKGRKWHQPHTDRMIQHFAWAKDAFGQCGVNIVNATAGGKLETFPRVDYAGLFAGRS